MPFNGLGQFSLYFSWVNDAANGIPITASRVQAEDQNIADGLSNVICRDGQSTTTAIVPFAMGLSTNAGIQFPAVQVPSASPNNLDDYEEGIFTPVDASGAGISFTTANGYYTKVGRLVVVCVNVQYPATGNSSDAIIGGLPFSNIATMITPTIINIVGGVAPSVALVARINGATSTVEITNSTSGAAVSNTGLSTSFVRFTITYFTS